MIGVLVILWRDGKEKSDDDDDDDNDDETNKYDEDKNNDRKNEKIVDINNSKAVYELKYIDRWEEYAAELTRKRM